MYFKQVWYLLALCGTQQALGDKVAFSSRFSTTSSDIDIKSKATGCTIRKEAVLLTCREPGSDVPSTVANAFSSVVDCQDMAPEFSSLTIQPGPLCAKVSFTLRSLGGSVNANTLTLQKGQMANFTCVTWPVNQQKGTDAEAKGSEAGYTEFSSVTVDITAKDAQNADLEAQSFEIGYVKFKSDDQKKVSDDTCLKGVTAAFGWTLTLSNSSHNVHELLWTSSEESSRQPGMSGIDVKSFSMEVSRCLQDIGFEGLKAKITSTSYGPVDAVQIQTSPAPKDYKDPMRHQEVVKLLVDATKLDPKEVAKKSPLEVSIEYTLPTIGAQTAKLVLPVEEPILPDSGKEKGGGGNWVVWLILAVLVLLIGVGAFLYRRNQMIQARAF